MAEASEIALTPAAAARVAAIAERQGKPAILRLSVEGGGCAGFSYRFGLADEVEADDLIAGEGDRKSTRLNSSHGYISYAVFCLKKKKKRLLVPVVTES